MAMVTAALVLAQTTVEADHVDGYTQLWVAPPTSTDVSTRVGVTSEQQQRRAYRLEIEVENRSGRMVRSFELDPGQTHIVTIPSDQAASPGRFKARLFRRGNPNSVYRRVSGWLPGRGTQ